MIDNTLTPVLVPYNDTTIIHIAQPPEKLGKTPGEQISKPL
jgi:hypothetical protein